jgi:hypothetical protein
LERQNFSVGGKRVIQYSRGSEARAERPRRTGCPLSPGHDNGGCGAAERPLRAKQERLAEPLSEFLI